MNTTDYIPLIMFKGQQVFYDKVNNEVVVERDHNYLTGPTEEERKPLIDEGLVTKLNQIFKEMRHIDTTSP
jgi:hypothetical protein